MNIKQAETQLYKFHRYLIWDKYDYVWGHIHYNTTQIGTRFQPFWENILPSFPWYKRQKQQVPPKPCRIVGGYSFRSALKHDTEDHNHSFHHCDTLISHPISWPVFFAYCPSQGGGTGLWDHLAVCVCVCIYMCMHVSILNHITNFHEAWYKYKAYSKHPIVLF